MRAEPIDNAKKSEKSVFWRLSTGRYDHGPSSLSRAACGEGEVKDSGFGTWQREERGQSI
jgi:hypothetical protein